MDESDEEIQERVRQQLAYVDALAKDCPMFAPDENQKGFYGAMQVMREALENASIISMGGFPASCVDLGWVKDKAEQARDEMLTKYGDRYVARVIELLLERTVQRVKFLTVFSNSEADVIDVQFKTKDDRGYYDYGFLVVLPPDWREEWEKNNPDKVEDIPGEDVPGEE